MSTRADVEQIEVTGGQRLLAVVLAGFLLLGGLWGYFELDLGEDGSVSGDLAGELSTSQRAALRQRDRTQQLAAAAVTRERERRQELVESREAYRTALDAGRDDPALARGYRESQRGYEAARADSRRRAAAGQAAAAAARPVEAELARIERAAVAEAEDRRRSDALVNFGLRLAYVLGALAAALRLMAAQRRRRSRWALTGYAAVGAAGALALAMGGDYVSEWVDPLALGPLVLAVAGAAITLAALGALQRHLARKLPGRRVRRRECPFCGYPADRGDHCEGCGRTVLAACASCAEPRRVGARHCAACGLE